MKDFAQRLRSLLTVKGLIQLDLVEDLGLSKSQVSNWCVGRAVPRFGEIITLAEYFGVSADYLLGIEPETAIEPQLPADEREVLDIYRRLSPKDKERIRTALEIFDKTETAQQQKKGG